MMVKEKGFFQHVIGSLLKETRFLNNRLTICSIIPFCLTLEMEDGYKVVRNK